MEQFLKILEDAIKKEIMIAKAQKIAESKQKPFTKIETESSIYILSNN